MTENNAAMIPSTPTQLPAFPSKMKEIKADTRNSTNEIPAYTTEANPSSVSYFFTKEYLNFLLIYYAPDFITYPKYQITDQYPYGIQ